jgi:hypothetical protein
VRSLAAGAWSRGGDAMAGRGPQACPPALSSARARPSPAR